MRLKRTKTIRASDRAHVVMVRLRRRQRHLAGSARPPLALDARSRPREHGRPCAASIPFLDSFVTMSPVTAILIFCLGTPGVASTGHPAFRPEGYAQATTPQAPATQPTASGSGRVTVTVALEGVRIPAVNVALRRVDGNIVVAQTTSDAIGELTFPDVPAGRYVVRAFRDGFVDSETAPFTVGPGENERVLVEMRLTFVRESVDVVVPANSPTESMQPVAVSDVLTGAKMDIQPLAGDDFQSLLTVLPSIIRDPQGRLRVKGGAPTTGALQVSSASLNDPSTGDFDLELPSGAVESVEVLSNPFAAEYGRFSTSVTQVRTKRGTNNWVVKPDNLVPGFGKGFAFVDKFEPRLSISGPLKRDRLLFGEYLQYHFIRKQIKTPPRQSRDRSGQLRLVHPARRQSIDASCPDRRPDLLSPQDHQRHALDVPSSGDDAKVHAGRILGGARRSADRVVTRRPRIDYRGAYVRNRSEEPGRASNGLRAAGPDRQLLQSPGAQRPKLATRRGADVLER